MGNTLPKQKVPTATAIEIKDNIPVTLAVVNENTKPLAYSRNMKKIEFSDNGFYDKLGFSYEAGETNEDTALMQRPETAKDRILDLLLVMDSTGSMQSWIELCKRTLKDCIDAVKKQHKDLEVRVAFIGYRDLSDGDTIFVVQDFTFDLDKVKAVISETRAHGGGDAPEDVQGALFQSLKLSWRNNSIKMCYFCTDAPCHGKQYHSSTDNYPEGNPAGLVLEKLMQEFSNKLIDFTVYSLTEDTKQMFEIMEQSYNQGQNAGYLKRIELQKDISQAKASGEKVEKPGGAVEKTYYVSTVKDMEHRAMDRYVEYNWL